MPNALSGFVCMNRLSEATVAMLCNRPIGPFAIRRAIRLGNRRYSFKPRRLGTHAAKKEG